MRTIFWFAYFILYQVYSIFLYVRYKWLQNAGSGKEQTYLHHLTRDWARSMVKAAGGKVTVTGIDNIPADQAVLFVSNHQGNFDIPLLLGYIDQPKGFVAKIELKKLPMVRTWMELIQCVFMDRNDLRQSLQVMNEAIQTLKNGHSMVIFPEGTRSKGGPVQEFKKGSLRLALKAQVPVIPIGISGSYRLMEAQGFQIKPASISIHIGKPILLHTLPKEDQQEAAALVQKQVQKLLEEAED